MNGCAGVLFLLNNEVLDLEIPEITLAQTVGNQLSKFAALESRQVVELGQDMYFKCGVGQVPDERARKTLACLLALKTEADAAIFVRPAGAELVQHVAVRFAALPMTTLCFLQSMQEAGELTARMINENVWSQAA